jgi:hypothetical protein
VDKRDHLQQQQQREQGVQWERGKLRVGIGFSAQAASSRGGEGLKAAAVTAGDAAAANFEAAIPGYSSMTGLERLKARTRLALQKADEVSAAAAAAAAADSDEGGVEGGGGGGTGAAGGGGGAKRPWTRYVFDEHAELEEEQEERLKMMDETVGHGMIAGLGSMADRAEEEQLISKRTISRVDSQRAAKEAAHEAAIFGGVVPGVTGGGVAAASSAAASDVGSSGNGHGVGAGGRGGFKAREGGFAEGCPEAGFAGLRSGIGHAGKRGMGREIIGEGAEGGLGRVDGTELGQGVLLNSGLHGEGGPIGASGVLKGATGLSETIVVQQQKGLSWREKVAAMKGGRGST